LDSPMKSFAVLALVNNISASQISRKAIPDGYHFNYDNLETSIKNTHDAAEAARVAAVNAQEAADAWRKGSTPNSGPVLSLHQQRAIPDGYHFNYDNLETSIKNTHDAAEAARVAAVNAQEAADAWRKGSTPNSGPVLSLSQNPADFDTYDTRFSDLEASLKDRQDKYYARVLWGNQQEEEYNAWRGIPWTPTKKDLGLESLAQSRAIPDGYHHNYDILEASILKAHSDAEDARTAAIAK
jgi:soluble cytochrome b562